MKKKILALAIGGVLSAGAQAGINDIVITEYVEGSSSNKAIELTNLSAAPHTFLTAQKLQYSSYANDIFNVAGTNVLEGITIGANETIVILSTDADQETKDAVVGRTILAASDKTNSGNKYKTMYFSGDDHVALMDGSKIKDIIGTYKAKGNNWGKDLTFRRKLVGGNIPAQKTTFDINDWEKKPKNTIAGLGRVPGADLDIVPFTCAANLRTKIEDIQGTPATQLAYARSPLATVYKGNLGDNGEEYQSNYESADALFVDGVVSAISKYPKNGFYLQQTDGTNPLSSDGIFVEGSSPLINDSLVGKTICLSSKAYEKYNLTFLKSNNFEIKNPVANIPVPVELKVLTADDTYKDSDGNPVFSFSKTLERYEGMLVKISKDMSDEAGIQSLYVSKTFSFDYDYFRHNMVMSFKRANIHPNQNNPAGSKESQNTLKENSDFSFYVEGNVTYTDKGHETDHYTDSTGTARPASDNIPYYASFNTNPTEKYIRVNDSVEGLEGVITYNSGYNKPASFVLVAPNKDLAPLNDALPGLKFEHNTPRKTAAELKNSLTTIPAQEIEVKIATQNVLNYFNSPFGGSQNNNGDNRGATTVNEYAHQKIKIVEAIRGLDADIVGLMEIENNGFGEEGAISELVNEINLYYTEPKLTKKHQNNSTSNRYSFIGFDADGNSVIDSDDSIGSDAITSGFIYRPEKVSLAGVKIITMPSQHTDKPVVNENGAIVKNYTGAVLESGDNYQRNSIVATFDINQTGKKLSVVVNHLKSKGSTCAEDWDGINLGSKTQLKFNEDKAFLKKTNGDYQANCENFRVAAAVQLGTELAKMAKSVPDQVIVGDMNSYAQEDPMLVLTRNPTNKIIKAARKTFIGSDPQFGDENKTITNTYGYLNAVSMMDPHGWSYAFGSEIGSLDHVLITPSLKDRLKSATDWHINAAESPLYDYNTDRKGINDDSPNKFYQPDAFRSSDHDSAIVVLSYTKAESTGEMVRIALEGGLANVPYIIPDAAKAQKNDIAKMSLNAKSSGLDMSKVQTSPLVLKDEKMYDSKGKPSYIFNNQPNLSVSGLKTGQYQATMYLERNNTKVPGSEVSININVTKQDSLTPKIITPKTDGSGGSFGIFGILSLLGLGFLRRK